MPDHFHGIVFVREDLPVHFGQIIAGFKYGTTRFWHQWLNDNTAAAEPQPTRQPQPLWTKGYHDRILRGQGQLQRMIDYVHDNPRRLAIKRAHPEFFSVQENIMIHDTKVAVLGNRFLLEWPIKVAVKCSRHMTQDEIAKECERLLTLVRQGAVLVSPAISIGEKTIIRAAFDAGCPVILLRENGFAPLAKPGGKLMDACAAGKLLLVAPWEHHTSKRAITRQQCNELNALAQKICGT